MKKVMVWLLILVCSIVSIGGLSEHISASTQTNASSSEIVVKEAGYLYYKTGTVGSNYKLVSQKVGSTKTTTLTTKNVKEFYVKDSYLYYVVQNKKNTSKYDIYRVRRDGKNKKCIVSANKLQIIGIQGDYIYYSYYKKYENVIVARIKVTGDSKSQKNLITTNTNYYNFKPVLANNKIYYTNNKKTTIYSLTLDGKKTEKLITNTSVRNLTAGKDGLYYICDKNDGTIKGSISTVMKVTFAGKAVEIDSFNQRRISEYRIAEGGVAADDYTDFIVNLEQVTADAIYYSVTDGHYVSYLFESALDGEKQSILINESDYGNYEWKYGVSGYNTDNGYQLFSFGGQEEPKLWFYADTNGTYALNCSPNRIRIIDGTAYYQSVTAKKTIYKKCKISKLFAQ